MADTAVPMPPSSPPGRRKRGWFLLFLGLINALWSLMVLAVLIAVGAVYFLYDRPVVMPGWVEARIETRLAAEFPQARIAFGEMRLLMEEGWRPRVRLREVTVSDLENRELIRFSEARAQLSMAALRAGRLQPVSVALNGVFATLTRAEDGTLSVQMALAGGQTPRAESPGALVRQVDRMLQQPGLAALTSAELRGLTLQFVDRRAGRAFTLDGGRLIAQRAAGRLEVNADLALLGDGPGVTTLAASYSSAIGATEAQFGVRLEGARAADIATQSPAFAWLGALRAPISGALRSGVRADGTLAPLNASLQIGAGVVQPNDSTRPIPFDAARSYFSYDAAQGTLRFDELSVRSQWVTGRAEGMATLTGLSSGALENLVGQFDITDLSANPMGLYPEPVVLERASMDFSLTPKPFALHLGRLEVSDQGQSSHASGTLAATPEGWRLALDAQADGIAPERVLALWPKTLKTKTRAWLDANLLGATLHNADFALRVDPGQKPRSFMAFEYADATVKFLKGLPPITRARGHASLNDDRFVVALDTGVLETGTGGAVAIERSAFIIPDTTAKPNTPAVVRLNVKANLADALWTVDQPPMRVMQRIGLPVALGDGQAALSGTLSFPLRKGGRPEDVTFAVAGELLEVDSDVLIKGRRLASDHMTLRASNTGVSIAGAGTLDGVGFDVRWQQPIGPGADSSTLQGSARITPEALTAFDVALPPGTLTGAGRADIVIDLVRGQPPAMTLRSDLIGIGLDIPQLGYRKPPATAGQLDMDIRLGSEPAVPRFALSGAGLRAEGAVTLATGGGLERLRLNRLRLGDWLDVPVDLVGQGPGRAPQVVLRGGRLDLRRAQFGSGSGSDGASGPPGPLMQVALDRLQITDTIWLSDMRGTFSTSGGLDGPFEARLNDGAAISGRVNPQRGRAAIRVTAQDAGEVLRSAGVLSQAVGGALDLSLEPVGRGGAFDGQLKVTGVSVKDAPSMAVLVNAVSVVGLVNEMNGDGIYFDEVEAEFRLTPNRMTLSRASAVGASLGLSMDGVFATDTGEIAMQGVITPLYLLNGIGSLLTSKGEGLIGFNYALRGTAKNPKVSINPLSALAPGGLRDMFRAPRPKLPSIDGEPVPDPLEEPGRSSVEDRYEGR